MPKLKPVDPQTVVLQAWRDEEVRTGELLTREELANLAGLALTYYFAILFKIPGVREKALELLKEKGTGR